MLLKTAFSIADRLKRAKQERPSLSTYFPKGTQFFYGYPSGDDSGFLNLVPPEVEELVAARVFCCAGSGVVPVSFSASSEKAVGNRLLRDLGIPHGAEKSIILPAEISETIKGKARNDLIKRELRQHLKPGCFVMAQPYLDDDLAEYYQIDPAVTSYFNDKHHMTEYISEQWLPKRYFSYRSGVEFAATNDKITTPVVIKVSSSSSGDGVCICRTQADLATARQRFGEASGRVIVEEYIEYKKSYGVHFGIPADRAEPADLIGINEQITTVHGEFLGGIIDRVETPPGLEGAVDHLMNHIVPQVRERGWHGIGGFDVLIDSSGRAVFIDANFRMTGMSAYHFLIDAGFVHRPMISVLGEFTGSETALREAIGQFSLVTSRQRYLKLICITRHEMKWRFNGALEYSSGEDLAAKVTQLLDAGVKSDVLEAVKKALAG